MVVTPRAVAQQSEMRQAQLARESFVGRHIGPSETDLAEMLAAVSADNLEDVLAQALPASIYTEQAPDIGPVLSETQALAELRRIGSLNMPVRSLIGQGYYGCIMPAPVRRQIFENPSWYTAYTPYQAEISQGRLEMTLNFQTMVADLCGLPMANASLLDEASAAAESMLMLKRSCKNANAVNFLVDEDLFSRTWDVLATRAEPLGIKLVRCARDDDFDGEGAFGALLGYPCASGNVVDRSALIARLDAEGVRSAVCTDLLALCLLKTPGAMGASVAVGSTQRFGLPLGCGGPHAAFMAFDADLRRQAPGRIVGVSRDSRGRPALRLALQTREQHIRRAKATSNICTAQVLPAILAAAYAVYHGPDGLKAVARRVHRMTCEVAQALRESGCELTAQHFFDTLQFSHRDADQMRGRAADAGFDLHCPRPGMAGLSLDETVTDGELDRLTASLGLNRPTGKLENAVSPDLCRSGKLLGHGVFNSYHSEQEFTRYLKRLADLDIALDRSMIPLGSCTMKLNAASQMESLSLPEFTDIHPFSPRQRREGYARLAAELGQMLCALTGMDAVSMEPNAGSQGELAGLLAIRGYLRAQGGQEKNICLIPESAHGTNPASAVLAGMKTVQLSIGSNGEPEIRDLREKAAEYSGKLAAIMITYPSTSGIYGPDIREICSIVHKCGGQVYMDGANMNALVGASLPGKFGPDVMHINLHKTFCIPHGGGGPGMGPVVCRSHLAPHLPGSPECPAGIAVSGAPLGSALLLAVSWAYIRMMGGEGLRRATAVAVLNANYMARRLSKSYRLAYGGQDTMVAHEFIIDAREFAKSAGVTVEDIAKRLIDMGFHAPTVSFPLPGSVMVEPTESESKAEMDRYCEALERIREEISKIERGEMPRDDNLLVNSPHPAEDLLDLSCERPYSPHEAAYPLAWVRKAKYWPPVSRIDQVYGDRNLVGVLVQDDKPQENSA